MGVGLAVGSVAPATATASVRDEIIVKREAGLSAAERADLRADADVRATRSLPLDQVEVVTAAPGDAGSALRELRADPDVVWAEPNRVRSLATGDPHWPVLWGLENAGQTVNGTDGAPDADIDAPQAWQLTQGGGATVAVVDTGVQPDHPDLAVGGGWDFVDHDDTPVDGNGHGTHVTGTISALDNDRGVVGVAPQSRVMPLRVLDDQGRGTSAGVASAFAYAGERGVRIVNASLGDDGLSTAEATAIAAHPNTLYVTAAGNDGRDNDSQPSYPCNYELANVVCVGASDSLDRRAPFSNYGGANVDLFAPGSNILSTYTGGGYAYANGTSMAAPHVAGVGALLIARQPELSAEQVKRALLAGTDAVAALAGLSATGGRLNAARSLGADATPPNRPAEVRAIGGDGQISLTWTPSPEADVAGYRVYPVAGGMRSTAVPALTVGNLAPASEHGYRVTAVDHAGNESVPSDTVTTRTAAPRSAIPAPAAPAASPSATGPTTSSAPALSASAGQRARQSTRTANVVGLRMSERVVVSRSRRKARPGQLSFRLAASSRVKITVAKRVCRGRRCAYRDVSTRTQPLARGSHRLAAGSALAGARLSAGAWRVSVGGHEPVPFAVVVR